MHTAAFASGLLYHSQLSGALFHTSGNVNLRFFAEWHGGVTWAWNSQMVFDVFFCSDVFFLQCHCWQFCWFMFHMPRLLGKGWLFMDFLKYWLYNMLLNQSNCCFLLFFFFGGGLPELSTNLLNSQGGFLLCQKWDWKWNSKKKLNYSRCVLLYILFFLGGGGGGNIFFVLGIKQQKLPTDLSPNFSPGNPPRWAVKPLRQPWQRWPPSIVGPSSNMIWQRVTSAWISWLKKLLDCVSFLSLLVVMFWYVVVVVVVTCYLLLVTCYLLLVTCYLLLVTCYLLLVTCYLLLVTRYLYWYLLLLFLLLLLLLGLREFATLLVFFLWCKGNLKKGDLLKHVEICRADFATHRHFLFNRTFDT